MDGAMTADEQRLGAIREMPAGLAGSVALHIALLAALFLVTPLRALVVPEPPAISVDLIPMSTFEPVPEPAARPQLAAPVVDTAPADRATPDSPAPAPVAGAPLEEAGGLFHATTLYATRMLLQSNMAGVRRGLGTLADSEKVMQLCNIEALEQIRLAAPQYDPDTMVSYAMSDPVASGLMLTALGGAFRSRRLWYGVSFECTAAPGLDGVTSFAFKLGAAIPEAEWEAHNLNAEDKAE